MDELFLPPTTEKIRCISLWQPWASLMGPKFIETRPWKTDLRGTIYFQAALTKVGLGLCENLPKWHLAAFEEALQLPFGQWESKLPYGAIVARGELVGIIPTEVASVKHPSQVPFGDFAAGRFAHIYSSIKKLAPIPCRGAQTFFMRERSILGKELEIE